MGQSSFVNEYGWIGEGKSPSNKRSFVTPLRKCGWKGQIVLLDGVDWELTLRELVFSVLILGVMFTVGFFLSGCIEERVNANNLKYNQAVALQSNDEFKHAMDTDVGYVFANGTLVADKPVKNEHLDGEWLWVSVEHQRYQMHTRRVAYTVTGPKGRSYTRYRTETYWSWDTVGWDSSNSPTVTYCGVQFPYDKFGYGSIHCNESKHSTGWHRRDVVRTRPKTFNATVFGEAKERTLSGSGIELSTKPIEEYRKHLTDSFALPMFWVLWSVLMVGALVAFYYWDNDWLED